VLIVVDAVKMETDHGKQRVGGVVWKAKDGGDNLPEDTLGKTEIRLYERSLQVLSKGMA